VTQAQDSPIKKIKMYSVVKATHWEVFGTLLSLAIVSGFADMFVVVGLPKGLSDALYIMVVIANIGWILVTGSLLELKRQGTLSGRSYILFITIGLSLVLTLSIVRILSLPDKVTVGQIASFIFTIYVFVSIFLIAKFTARKLRSLEVKEEIDINDYFGDIFRIIFWPVGVWSIQLRVNAIFGALDMGPKAKSEVERR
jgi:hypothetical protein